MNSNRQDVILEIQVFFRHIAGLLPGFTTPVFPIHTQSPGDMAGWSSSDYRALIEQGRIQLARQRDDIEHVRGRAQVLFSTSLGSIGLSWLILGTVVTRVSSFIFWTASVIVLAIALLGAASVVVSKKTLGEIDTTLLSLQHGNVERALAAAYATSISAGENAVGTEITVFRDAVMILIAGFALLVFSGYLAILR